ncbi:MAG: hypothetical protein D6722_00220, partial [Bacteroidetes bacterium]
YDSLGAEGILNVAATMNTPADVDASGDMPTACPSPWLVTVTNTTPADTRNPGAAFGAMSIDLGAPGSAIYSTIPGGNYGFSTGTSQAAPQVTGAISLLFSAACPALLLRYRNDPAATALIFRDFILDGVDTLASLQGQVATGGRLNLRHSLELLADSCALLPSDCLPPYNLAASSLTDSSVLLSWLQQGSADSFVVRFRTVGGVIWSAPLGATGPSLSLSGLSRCTDYEFQVQAYCGDDSSGYWATAPFRSEGCCEPPAGRQASSLTDSSARLFWRPVYGALDYRLQYRPAGDTAWQEIMVSDTTFVLDSLMGCTGYQWRVASRCDSGGNQFSPERNFSTRGCGACLDRAYCESAGQDFSFEWIGGVQLGPLDRLSGPDSGYANVTDLSYQFVVDSTYDLTLIPGYGGFGFQEVWRLWIDLNQDGGFSDSTELLFEGGPQAGPIQGQLQIPAGAPTGPTRLRVSMKFPGFSGVEWPEACGTFAAGEVEDYCITLSLGDTAYCPALTGLSAAYLPGTDSLRLGWDALPGASLYDLRVRRVGLGLWQEASLSDTALFFTNLDSCATYEWQVRARCGDFGGVYSPLQTFTSQGCGACVDLPYCSAGGESSTIWLETAFIGAQVFNSGPNGGYASFASIPVGVVPGDSLTLTLVPGFATVPRPLGWYAWADWNQDGSFSPDEQLFARDSLAADTLRLRVAVPAGSLPGLSRLRLRLRAPGSGDPCGPQGAGEVEDFCLSVGTTPLDDPAPATGLRLFPNPTTGGLTVASDRPLGRVDLYDLQG